MYYNKRQRVNLVHGVRGKIAFFFKKVFIRSIDKLLLRLPLAAIRKKKKKNRPALSLSIFYHLLVIVKVSRVSHSLEAR